MVENIQLNLAIIGWQEGLIILLIAVLIFGASRIPQLGDALGKGIRNFKKSISGEDEKGGEDKKSEDDNEK